MRARRYADVGGVDHNSGVPWFNAAVKPLLSGVCMCVCDVDWACIRFRTNPDLGATEKLTVCDPSSSHMLETDYTPLPMLNPGALIRGIATHFATL